MPTPNVGDSAGKARSERHLFARATIEVDRAARDFKNGHALRRSSKGCWSTGVSGWNPVECRGIE
jgi:hypothetical protein